jgi:geranylgeranyl pyrophosphate synthase
MSARARQRTSAPTGFVRLADDALSPDRLLQATYPEDWPEPSASPELPRAIWDRALGDVARDILGRPSRQFRARLCELAWRLADGHGDLPAELPAVVEIAHAGSLIVDDIEDGSERRRGGASLHLTHGLPRALNAGSWMYFWAMALVDDLPLPPAIGGQIRGALANALYRGHLGQALDVSISIGRMPRAWIYRVVVTSTMLKTGALMELAARTGALAAQAPADRLEALARFGRRLGLGLQMLDDFGNLTTPASDAGDSKALEDLRNGRPTWPWARAALDLDDRAFSELQAAVRALGDDGDPDGTRARALAAQLRMAVGLEGRRQAAVYLETALDDLRAQVGDRREVALLAAEIQRLEVSYG